MSAMLQAKIAAVRRKHSAVSMAVGFGYALVAAIILLAAGMLWDWLVELPLAGRAVALLIDLAVLGYLFVRYMAMPVVFGPDDDEIALWVERELPGFQTRLIASVQLARPGAIAADASSALVRAMIAQTEEFAEPVPFTQVIKPNAMVWSVGVAGVLLLVALAALNWMGKDGRDLLQRAFLVSGVQVPRKTQVECVSKGMKVAKGDSVNIVARAHGIRPDQGKVSVTSVGGQKKEYQIDPTPSDRALYQLTLKDVPESFTYVIALGDGHSEPFAVKVVERPVTLTVRCEQTFPRYTGMPPQMRTTGDLSLLAGSKLKITATANKNVTDAQVRLMGLNQSPKLRINPQDYRELSTEPAISIPDKGLSGFSLHIARDEDELQSQGEVVYRIDILPDKPPTMQIKFPEHKTEKVTAQSRLRISFDASDDWGIAKLQLCFKVNDGPVKVKPMDLEGKTPKSLTWRYEWELISENLVEGQTVTYWLEAEDNNNVTGPGKAKSGEPYTLKVVSPAEKREDLLSRVDELWRTIDDTKLSQEELNAKLGEVIHEKQ